MVHIFMIGGTGHVGGAVLDLIVREMPSATVTTLVRTKKQAKLVGAKYSEVRCLVGDLESFELLARASREADIVINCGPDITHDEGIRTVLNALRDRPGPRPYYLHTSGAFLICDLNSPCGELEDRVWDDVDDIEQLISMPDSATHAVTDKLVRAASPEVNVAIIAPGGIGGMSPSVSHPMPISMAAIFSTARAFGSGFQVGPGANCLGMIDVRDLARMYRLLLDDAAAALGGGPGAAAPPPPFPLWGPRAYYFGAAEDSVSWAAIQATLAPLMVRHGVVAHAGVASATVADVARRALAGDSYDPDAPPPPADSWAMHIAYGFGANLRVRATRMRRLGWAPQHVPVAAGYDEVVPQYLGLEKAQLAAASAPAAAS